MPPPDGIDSLKAAGFNVTTGPHVWPWFYGQGANSPLRDMRMRKGLRYCVDRDGLVTLLNGMAEPAGGWLKPSDPNFGSPKNRYAFDLAKRKALLAAAGYGPGKPLSLQGDDLQFRLQPDGAAADERVPLQGAVALNVSLPSSDIGVTVRYFAARSFSPAGFNWEHWTDEAALGSRHRTGKKARLAARLRNTGAACPIQCIVNLLRSGHHVG